MAFRISAGVVGVWALALAQASAIAQEPPAVSQGVGVIQTEDGILRVETGTPTGPAAGPSVQLHQLFQSASGGRNGGASYAVAGGGQLSLADNPVVVVTRPMPGEAQDEWVEDLKVMDRLLREAVGRVSGQSSLPQAMGIRVTLIGDRREPMYVEDCGALFSYSVGFPLAASAAADQPAEDPSSGDSPWERAQRELKSGRGGQVDVQTAGPSADATPRPFGAGRFEGSKVDALLDALLMTLPQAKNFRHLRDSEFVFVTIAGVDDRGAPIRMSLSAQKSDIDKAASGELDAEAFKARVTMRVG